MRHIFTTLLLLVAAIVPAFADEPLLLDLPMEPGDGRVPYAKGYYRTVIDGEEVKMIVLNDVTVFPPMKFKNKKQEEFYWKTLRDVRKTLPYAKLICATLLETYEYIETFPTEKERNDYLKRMESAIFQQYKPVLKKFTKSQAQILIKLIKRETNQSGYSIIKAFLGTFRAGFWQTFGRFFGVNLRGDYKPDKDDKDAIIERICVGIELGTL
ncbi:MAG: DUF4294 domain-containing protein [Bacteroides sp.]|nr:DUF4294 domain-containing protein [Bacteroides sp.]MCM1413809.1 DUF4294 domain-containing protein [Bacteroides sp.]MCM1471247.1 DUF4294 domain-containing protein [Bacteroides sp.]